MISLTLPEKFENPMEVVGCFVEYDGKILLLERHPDKLDGLFFGAPGGKLDAGESKEGAIAREVFEETGIQALPEAYKDMVTFYVTHDHTKKNYIYHNFRIILDTLPEVRLSTSEHISYVWVAPHEAHKLKLIFDEDNCIAHFYGNK